MWVHKIKVELVQTLRLLCTSSVMRLAWCAKRWQPSSVHIMSSRTSPLWEKPYHSYWAYLGGGGEEGVTEDACAMKGESESDIPAMLAFNNRHDSTSAWEAQMFHRPLCQCHYKSSQTHLQIHVTDGEADRSNWVLQFPATNGWPASNTDYSRQALERVLRRADVWTELCVQANSVILGQCDLVQEKRISACQREGKVLLLAKAKEGPWFYSWRLNHSNRISNRHSSGDS